MNSKFPIGLDRWKKSLLNRVMGIKSLLTQLGLGKLIGKTRVSPMVRERQHFEADVRRQFEELKKKGLSIPVFTL